MDFETVSPEEFGASLRGLGLNLLVRDVKASAAFLERVFGMTAHRVSADFAIMTYGGRGVQIHLFDTDPDPAVARAEATGGMVLARPRAKPHGLVEAFILDPDGYCWVVSRPK